MWMWAVVFVSVVNSLVKALNIGYQQETYVLSSLIYLPLIYNGYIMGSNPSVVLNGVYFLTALLGIYRHSEDRRTKKKELK